MKKEYIILGIIFFIVLGTRLFFAFQTQTFSSDEAYYNIRQVEHIKETFLPMTKDDLSYGGKTLYLPPLFYYTLAALNFIFPIDFVGKFFPNLFASLMVILAYLIAEQLTKDKTTKFFTALIAGFMPIFFAETLNSISIYSFVLPILFFALYCMIRIINKEKRYIAYFITSLLILRITTPSVIFLVFALLIYLLFLFLEKIKSSKIEVESILFSTFLIVWTLFVSFKNVFLNHGFVILWQNIPKELLKNYFIDVNILTAIYLIGILPFAFGLYTIYKYIFEKKDKKIYLLISFAIVVSFLMWLRLIELNLALIFVGFVMSFLFAKIYPSLYKFTRNKKIKLTITLSLFLLILISSVIPSLVLAANKIKQSYSDQEIEALNWINENTGEKEVILSTISEGHLITTIAKRRNFIDSNFMFVEDIDQRVENVYKMYRTTSETQAIRLLNEYNIKYIYFSKRAKEEYKIDKLFYIEENCFERVFINKDVEIYKTLCVIEEK
ncbi:hypothetical protein CEE44_02415 [Candidatus Woesearchaeota archaeon B3_Woes]|nr:MAG: hypothetical protein CEE44_02415 [Candidatus Woesearchaeota archaeon B3_Woes]